MNVGRPRNMKEPKELLKMWDEYKKNIDGKPDKENIITVKGDVVVKKTKKPYLKQGFESFVFRKYGFSIKDYLSNTYKEFSDVVTCIRSEWEEDQISGTITGKYKAPNLVARLNGLKEHTSAEISGSLNIPSLPDIGKRKKEIVMNNYNLQLSLIPNGSLIKDIESAHCYYEGYWNNGMYTVSKVIWDGLEYPDDEMVGKKIHLQWYQIEVYDANNNKILGT